MTVCWPTDVPDWCILCFGCRLEDRQVTDEDKSYTALWFRRFASYVHMKQRLWFGSLVSFHQPLWGSQACFGVTSNDKLAAIECNFSQNSLTFVGLFHFVCLVWDDTHSFFTGGHFYLVRRVTRCQQHLGGACHEWCCVHGNWYITTCLTWIVFLQILFTGQSVQCLEDVDSGQGNRQTAENKTAGDQI